MTDDDPIAGPWGPDPDPRVQAGLEHLQRAAREMIAASRALLDVAEEVVEDPKSASGIIDLLSSLAARSPLRAPPTRGWDGTTPGWDDDRADSEDEDDPPVQRIPVS